MKTKAVNGHDELTSMMFAVISIVKFIIVIVGIALMVFK